MQLREGDLVKVVMPGAAVDGAIGAVVLTGAWHDPNLITIRTLPHWGTLHLKAQHVKPTEGSAFEEFDSRAKAARYARRKDRACYVSIKGERFKVHPNGFFREMPR